MPQHTTLHLLPCQQRFLVATQPVGPLPDSVAPVGEGILFLHGHLRKGSIGFVWDENAVPAKALARFWCHDAAVAFSREQHGIGVLSGRERESTYGSGRLVRIGGEDIVQT